MAQKTAFCEYADCGREFNLRDMEKMADGEGGYIYVCNSCQDRMDDQTGFCSMSCQLGYGCDDSC